MFCFLKIKNVAFSRSGDLPSLFLTERKAATLGQGSEVTVASHLG